MSSSKIMSYNLDDSVLNGVAQEDTLESISTSMAKELTLESLAETVNTMKTTLDTLAAAGSDSNSNAGVPIRALNMTGEDIRGTRTVANVTGKGFFNLIFDPASATDNKFSVVIDGNNIFSNDLSYKFLLKNSYQNNDYYLSLRFKKSLVISVKGTDLYAVTTYGTIYFEE